MNRQMLEVMQRRGDLLARIASQREQAAQIGARWEAPLAFADKCLGAVRFLRSRPALVVGVVALFVVRRRGLIGLARGGGRGGEGDRYFAAVLAKAAARGFRPKKKKK